MLEKLAVKMVNVENQISVMTMFVLFLLKKVINANMIINAYPKTVMEVGVELKMENANKQFKITICYFLIRLKCFY